MCCVKLRPADLLALGRLYLGGGRQDGIQVVPAAWVDESTSPAVALSTAASPFGGFGYLWWTTEVGGHPAHVGWGWGGQMVTVVPGLDLVVVLVSEVDEEDARAANEAIYPATAIDLVATWIVPHLAPAD
jgi:CubicO group peptidase (beta-lactamase class C family)